MDETAKKHQTQPATIALAWLLQRPSVAAPIVSATSVQQLESIIEAPSVVLDAEDVRKLDV
ncbi:aldo/keto reductase [Pseudopedobacter beijingensis]|uniref:Aldo/keto reductase n=1 Tax=Pseudopedobacter beijingensis TaxID=1207056 RepID=A0ABW4IDH2_9SPHI